MSDYYRFPCGCRWPITGPAPREGALPLMEVDDEHLPFCSKVWELLGRGDTKGIFQLESSLGRQWTKKLLPKSAEHLGALGALLRPGCLRAIVDPEEGITATQQFCRVKNGISDIKLYHPVVDEILKPTYGVLTYQEQSMSIAKEVAGFNLQEADQLRKCVTGDTRFLSRQRGWLAIDTLLATGYKDDEFLIMDEKGVQSWKHLVNIWHTGKHDVNEVLSSSGFSVRATKYHQFLTADSWKARMRLRDGEDHLVAVRETSYEGRDTESVDLAMVIAGLVTEGHMIDGKRNCTFVAFDAFMMDTFEKHFENVFGSKPRYDSAHRVARLLKEQKDSLVGKVKFGLSGVKELPEWMMGMTKEATRQFLSFMLAAEGGVTESTGQFEFSSKSLRMIRQVKLLLTRFSVRSLLAEKEVPEYGVYYRLYVNSKIDQQKMLDELTANWPRSKFESLKLTMERKNDKNFTSDIVPTILTGRFINQYPNTGRYESGTAFTAQLSRPRFSRMVERSGDNLWRQIATGKHQYDLVKSTKERSKERDTYDFTVEGGDTPYIVADGLVVHNSIGKKLPEEMAKVKKMFISGAEKAGIVSTEQAEELFSWIEASQRYAFNKSHSISYGLTGYDTAYFKAHFPVAFYCSWLRYAKEKMDPLQEIYELVNDAKLNNIAILPPDLRSMEPHFSTDGISVRFGLADIKSIGELQVPKIRAIIDEQESVLGRKIAEWNWLDFLFFASDKLSSTVVKRLIWSGGLTWLGMSRQRMENQYHYWANELTDGERRWITERELIGHGLLKADTLVEPLGPEPDAQVKGGKPLHTAWRKKRDAFQAKMASFATGAFSSLSAAVRLVARTRKCGGAAQTEARVETLKSVAHLLDNPLTSLEDTSDQIAWNEKEWLGIALTCSTVQDMDLDNVNTTCKEFADGKDGYMVFGVTIEQVREVKTRKGKTPGQKMAFLTVADATCSLSDVIVFPDAWHECSCLLKTGNCIIMQAEKDPKRGSLLVKRVSQMQR